MTNFLSTLLSSIVSPHLTAAVVSTCTINGQPVDCAGFTGLFAGVFGGFILVGIAFAVLMIVSNWKIYTKAGKPGWTSIVPIYNFVVLLDIVGKPAWWVILMFIPFVNVIMGIIVVHRLSLSFGKDIGFTIGLLLLSPIFYPILGFGSAQYQPLNSTAPRVY